ncbi:hypothetical protein [Olivibacter sitiensis]|uniref:hypothetical protein n=1 Tax=Olivibacter sitiensis TaxID=376470 RepID=UPI000422EA0C|nr:hypothetical protein [Olivibacter sitiensis]
MNTASHYKLLHFIPWTRRHIFEMLLLSIVPTVLLEWLATTWVPVAFHQNAEEKFNEVDIGQAPK